MAKYSNVVPDGERDLLFKECKARREVENKLSSIFKSHGFSEVITPSLEFYDVFSGKNSVMDEEIMYKLIDSKGRILVLRPDSTTPIARIVSTKLKDFLPPLRLYYNQNIFRINPSMSGRHDEISQCGVELIGVSGQKADIEMIATAVSALKSVIGGDFRFEIGHVGFFKAIVDALPFEKKIKERIRSFVSSKNYASLNTLLESSGCENAACHALRELPRLFGEGEVLDRALAFAPNPQAVETISYLKSIYSHLSEMGLEKNIMIDLGLVQQIDYYTGVVFRGYMQGYGELVLSGGRYDGLYSKFGKDMPATGFAVNVDAIARSQSEFVGSDRPDILVYYDIENTEKAFAHVEELIHEGHTCEMSVLDTVEAAAEYARRKGIKRVDRVDTQIRTITTENPV